MPQRIHISDQLRTTLNALRSIAAIYVVFHHLATKNHPGSDAIHFLRFGQEAVIVFFLLSGFVIHANESRRTDIGQYYLRRIYRIYPTLLVAIILSGTIFWSNGTLAENFDIRELLGTIFALQDLGNFKPGTIVEPFLGNTALWSLSYEIVFYIIYPLFLALFRKKPQFSQHIVGITCLLLIVSYNIWPSHFLLLPSYFIIWWVGAMAAETYLAGNNTARDIGTPLIYLAICTGLWATIVMWTGGYEHIGTYPVLMLRHFLFALVAVILGFGSLGRSVGRYTSLTEPMWTYISSISYGIYVLHVPLLIQWEYSYTKFGLAVSIVALVVLAHLSDRKLHFLIQRRRQQ